MLAKTSLFADLYVGTYVRIYNVGVLQPSSHRQHIVYIPLCDRGRVNYFLSYLLCVTLVVEVILVIMVVEVMLVSGGVQVTWKLKVSNPGEDNGRQIPLLILIHAHLRP